MLYSGKELPDASGWGTDPALINPKLPVNNSSPDSEGHTVGYWPSYSDITPEARSAYLGWLAGGKCDPNAYIGYVFMYFYGLERRVLVDLKDSRGADKELADIKTEVERLLSIYKLNNSFRNYASSFLDILNALHSKDKLYLSRPPSGFKGYDFPAGLKIGLAQMAADGVPLPSKWALSWIECRPYFDLRTPAKRCHEEFKRLFTIRYSEKYGEGLSLKPGKKKLTASYIGASASLRGRSDFSLSGLFDISSDDHYLSQLSSLAETCIDELDAYSRYLGRNKGKEDTIEATALLPSALVLETTDCDELSNLRSWLEQIFNDEKEMAIVDGQEMMKNLPSIDSQKVGKKELTTIAQLLSKLNVGIEPDVRFGSPSSLPETVCLFPLTTKAAIAPSPEYSAASIILHLAAAVSAADGVVSPEEEQRLEEQLKSWLHLDWDQQQRLQAHMRWLLSTSPKLTGLKKRLGLLEKDQREAVGKFVVSVAQADGFIGPEEIKTLTKIYKLLELDTKELFSHAHSAAAEPVTIRKESVFTPGHSIPEPSQIEDGSALDTSNIEAKLAETAAVSALLRNIFAEEEHNLGTEAPEAELNDEDVYGLNTEQARFMRRLAEKAEWAREELEATAAESNLLLDGVLDSLNDIAYEEFDELFFEGEDPIVINQEVAKEMCNARDKNPA